MTPSGGGVQREDVLNRAHEVFRHVFRAYPAIQSPYYGAQATAQAGIIASITSKPEKPPVPSSRMESLPAAAERLTKRLIFGPGEPLNE